MVRALLTDLGFLLLIGAAVAPRLLYVRLLIGGAAFLWIGRAALAGDNGGATWAGLLFGICAIMVCRALWLDQKAAGPGPREAGAAAVDKDGS